MFTCNICNVTAKTICNFRAHLATKRHITNAATASKNQLILDNSNLTLAIPSQPPKPKFSCKCCKKELSSKFNLKRHIETCEEVKLHLQNRQQDMINELVNDIQISNVDTALSVNQHPINIVINNITNNNTNNTNNTNNNLEVNFNQFQNSDDEYYEYWKLRNLNPVGFENLDMLKEKHIADKIHSGGLNAFIELIKVVYSDNKNHNVALYNQREKLVKFLNASGEIEITTFEKILDLLVQNNIDVLDKFLDDDTITIKKTYKNVIDKLKEIHQQDGDNPYFTKYLAALRLVLLNISKSALAKITEFENIITNDITELAKVKRLSIPSTALRLATSNVS